MLNAINFQHIYTKILIQVNYIIHFNTSPEQNYLQQNTCIEDLNIVGHQS